MDPNTPAERPADEDLNDREAQYDLLMGALLDYLEATHSEEAFAAFMAQAEEDHAYLMSCLDAINEVSSFVALAMHGSDELFKAVAPALSSKIGEMEQSFKNIWTYHLMHHAQLEVAPASEVPAGLFKQRMQWMLDRIGT